MAVIIKFPIMDVVDEDEYVGDKSEVIEADAELQRLVDRFFELNRDISHWKNYPLLRILPKGFRIKKLNDMSNELKEVFNRIQDKVYNETGA